MAEYEFDAHVVVEWAGTKAYAADKILEHCMDADIAISLHEEGTLNVSRLSSEHGLAFEAGWNMYADNSLGPRVPDQREQAKKHYFKRVSGKQG